jgi:hypothetical protein
VHGLAPQLQPRLDVAVVVLDPVRVRLWIEPGDRAWRDTIGGIRLVSS